LIFSKLIVIQQSPLQVSYPRGADEVLKQVGVGSFDGLSFLLDALVLLGLVVHGPFAALRLLVAGLFAEVRGDGAA
jgi:hypothetical protein